MKKVLLIIAVVLMALTANAESYNIYVAGVEVTSDNSDAIAGNSKWVYRPVENQLLLYADVVTDEYAAILNNNTEGTLNICISDGCTKISAKSYGILSMGDILINGSYINGITKEAQITSNTGVALNTLKKLSISYFRKLELSGASGIVNENDTLSITNATVIVNAANRAVKCKHLVLNKCKITDGSIAETSKAVTFTGGTGYSINLTSNLPSGVEFLFGNGEKNCGQEGYCRMFSKSGL